MLPFLKKNKNGKNGKLQEKNWYADRYQSAVVQRNFLALVVVCSLIGIIFSVLSVIKISSSKTIEPFVIEIEEKTGITNVIRPLLQEQFTYDETLKRYFLTLYLNSRQTYSPGAFQHNYYTVVRLYSSAPVYNQFRSELNSGNAASPLRLGNNSRSITIKSFSFLKPFTAQIRFLQYDGPSTERRNEKHLLATITFQYVDMVLSNEDRAINPLGFQVTEYRVDEEVVK